MEEELFSEVYKILHNDEDLFDIVEEIEYDDYELPEGEFDYD